MPTDTYAEQRPGTAVMVVGYFAHCLIIIHGHPAINTKQASSQKQAMQLPTGRTCQRALPSSTKVSVWKNIQRSGLLTHVFTIWSVLDFAKQEIQALD